MSPAKPAPFLSSPEGPVQEGAALPEGIPQPGAIIAGKYQIESVIGSGGMGVVVSAVHVTLRQRYAVKFLFPAAMKVPDAIARFVREAQSAVAIQSEHVTRVFDVGTLENGAPYIVMEHLSGCNLWKLLRSRQTLPYGEAVDLILQACEALAEAHALGIVHRDLKPTNLFLTTRADGSPLVKVLDFGLSKVSDAMPDPEAGLTMTDIVIGSPFYMSPEQIRSLKHVDARTDIWALGVILYQLMTGRRPFNGDNLASVCVSISVDPIVPIRKLQPGVPAALDDLVLRCMEKDIERRVQSVAELAHGLASFAGQRALVSVERAVNVLANPRRSITGPVVATAPTAPQPPQALWAPALTAEDTAAVVPWMRSFEAFLRAYHAQIGIDEASARFVTEVLARWDAASARMAQIDDAARQAGAALAQARARHEEAERLHVEHKDAVDVAILERDDAVKEAQVKLRPIVDRLQNHDDMTNAIKRQMGILAAPAPLPAPELAVPTGVMAVAQQSRINVVMWERGSNPPATSYLVEAAVGSVYRGSAVMPDASAFRVVATVVDAASCAHNAGRVPVGTLVKYRVRASRAQMLTTYSNEVLVACK